VSDYLKTGFAALPNGLDLGEGFFAFQTGPESSWSVCPTASVQNLGRALSGESEYASNFEAWYLADDRIIEIRFSWWSPKDRVTYRDKRDGSYAPARWVSEGCKPFDALAQHYERITIDLATGDEVPA
jgi:hypothetical protein